ncbi:winged helix-turn-helix transcriptional regulator [Microbacterium hydrocarbonoxydans]|uniref:winged helix-turn-helix transcriptional regulator n=1 Tax=Microbacterium hydrocarbonoxydans TaxID=273678 RepID=UPI0020409ADD|nr:helix-turn-helix domain-containing protein [Microbacterium hydrocarbonoxydans]MCM3778235.1 helix-turn-helix transcriptional regulator [Microbacterium hydrocarbonoxydans]
MPLRSDWSTATCPIARSADVLADPWVLLILRELFSGRSRFDELRDATGAADSVLARRLSAMTGAGLLARDTERGYALTDAGRETLPILHALARFSRVTDPDGPWGLQTSCARCGEAAASVDWCTHCEAPLDAESTLWARRSLGGEPFALVTGVPA